ncbi:energy transducer TonB [Sphingosinithalassobacter sp. LHW66-3]|uniref:energy transducer TonB n=1 Tax=Sphingosinithalassobacter sp. LHW66-3 TaxID=3424718 RepID=UPI003D6C0364
MTVMMMLAAAVLAQDAPGVASRAELVSGSISNTDYPAEAMRAGEEGEVEIRFAIDTSGYVTGCSVVESSGSVSLDVASCVLITERFRFEPARSANGAPVSEMRTQRIRWELPEPADEPLTSFALAMRYELAPDGSLADCEIVPIGNVPDDAQFCDGPPGMPSEIKAAMLREMAAGQSQLFTSIAQVVGDERLDVPPPPPALSHVERATIRFTVGADGLARDCTIDASGLSDPRDRTTSGTPCEDGTRYEPVHNGSGDPVSVPVRIEIVRALAYAPSLASPAAQSDGGTDPAE